MQAFNRQAVVGLLSFLAVGQLSAMPAVSNRAEADAYFEANRGPAPDGYELRFNDCTEDACSLSRAVLVEALPQAHQKNYQAQRNLAYCLEQGCDGAIEPDIVEGCAWRFVILASDSSELNPSDAGNLDLCVRHLQQADLQRTKIRATELVLRIYGEGHLKNPL